MSNGVPVIKTKRRKSSGGRLADSADGMPEHYVATYLILFDRLTKTFRAYHADMEELVVVDDDPVEALATLVDIVNMEVQLNEDELYN